MDITDWIVAVGTGALVIVAIVALFQDIIKSWIIKPDLAVTFSLKPPDCHKTEMRLIHYGNPNTQAKSPAYYFRLRISNNSKNCKAEKVEVIASKLLRKNADGTYSRVDDFTQCNLEWSIYHGTYMDVISPETDKLCDLLHIADPKKRKLFRLQDSEEFDENKTIICFDTAHKPFNKMNLRQSGNYKLEIIVAASNLKPIKKTLEINVTGKWYDDLQEMVSKGIGIKIL